MCICAAVELIRYECEGLKSRLKEREEERARLESRREASEQHEKQVTLELNILRQKFSDMETASMDFRRKAEEEKNRLQEQLKEVQRHLDAKR